MARRPTLAKGPNQRPDKGFIKELAKAPAKVKTQNKFTYSKPITPQSSKAQPMSVPSRIREYRTAKDKVGSTLVAEFSGHVKKRRGEK